jgi:hypothetical protein
MERGDEIKRGDQVGEVVLIEGSCLIRFPDHQRAVGEPRIACLA